MEFNSHEIFVLRGLLLAEEENIQSRIESCTRAIERNSANAGRCKVYQDGIDFQLEQLAVVNSLLEKINL